MFLFLRLNWIFGISRFFLIFCCIFLFPSFLGARGRKEEEIVLEGRKIKYTDSKKASFNWEIEFRVIPLISIRYILIIFANRKPKEDTCFEEQAINWQIELRTLWYLWFSFDKVVSAKLRTEIWINTIFNFDAE